MTGPISKTKTGSNQLDDKPSERPISNIEIYAQSCAAEMPAVQKGRGKQLPILQYFDRFNNALQAIHQRFSETESGNSITSYSQEWLLDNYYIVQQSLAQVHEDLPPSYYYELPKLTSGQFAEYARVYALGRAFITYTEGHITQSSAQTFLINFQERIALTMGELWAWPTMLRLCALENLIWSLEKASKIEDFSLLLEEQLGEQLTRQRPEPQLMVASSITNMRLLNTQDWSEFFESVSRVEGILRRDPARIYALMDFETRNEYRDVIEKLASRTEIDEEQIAETVLHVAQKVTSENTGYVSDKPVSEQSRTHVGFYLIDEGYHHLLETLNFNTFRHSVQSWFQKHLLSQTYIVTIALVTLWLVVSASIYARLEGGTVGQIILSALVVLIPASAIAINLINWLLLQQIKPAKLPKLDFNEGIPEEFRTVVVIPALLSDIGEIDSLVAQLELHYLRNTDPNLRFAILADYTDAPEQHMSLDAELAAHARTAITELNRRYGSGEHQPFYFLLRERRWNASENTWMGHERKRGKLAEFNRLLLDTKAITTYSVKHGDMAGLNGIRYVITLDADTIMPHNAAHHLIGTLAHPLNQAVFSPDGNRVIAGYTVLQPRVELLPTVKNRTLFAQVMGGDAGFDLYTMAISDIYQDLFGEGVYVGKGIYDVEAFERSTAGRIPENALLSHDLFEGVQGRAGLVTDIVLIEDYPTHYLAFTQRLHRWIRGDWQLLPWLLPYVAPQDGKRIRNQLSTLSYWKIFDNLRRSLERPAILTLLVAGWIWLPGSIYVWTVFALLVLWIPFMLGMFLLMRSTASGKQRTSIHEIRFTVLLKRWSTSLVFLPYESILTLDAIIRTFYRLVRRKHLLEWVAAASTMRVFGEQTRLIMWRHMARGVILAVAIGVVLFIFNPAALLVVSPLLASWLLAPAFAEHLSQPYTPPADEQLTEEDTRQLRMLARRTWLFFEAFVGPQDHWLPPDHFQRQPEERIKHYTSPTNIGLMLISTLGAREMGYIGLLDLMLRLRFAFDSIEQLERYRGHLLNWYQTQTLDPLLPRYVSTVDSGNYAGCLIALKEGCRSLLDSPALNPEQWQGFIDILDIIAEILCKFEAVNASENVASVNSSLSEMREHLTTAAKDLPHWSASLSDIMANEWPKLEIAVTQLAKASREKETGLVGDLSLYLGRLHHHASNMQRDIESLLPWQILHQSTPPEVRAMEVEWSRLQEIQESLPYLRDLPHIYQMIRQTVDVIIQNLDVAAHEARSWCDEYIQAIDASEMLVLDMLANFDAIQHQISQDVNGMDFRFLYHKERDLFRIGYNVENEQADSNHYDLLASEARLASYIAIAKGDAPYKHWLHLGRPMILLDRGQVLHSWSGTMFEYLMPMLLMQHETETLLNNSASAAISKQISYAKQHNTPWGISESGFYAFDVNENFQYRAFGVPDLALKRGQDLDHVVTPYASLLALPLRPAAVVENLRLFKEIGVLDTYGVMEAVDYTTARLPLGHEHALVDEYMSHHQGMIFISLVNFLQQNSMVRHFHANPYVTSVELLLLEQIPLKSVTCRNQPKK
jgi:cyclic beta-1,2-glucan synthetase